MEGDKIRHQASWSLNAARERRQETLLSPKRVNEKCTRGEKKVLRSARIDKDKHRQSINARLLQKQTKSVAAQSVWLP